ncbi:hypothetical protein QBC40DRAFT_319322 [Triangularia verruculosa]|uniref:PLL-like beta propeller domain-containing protein n=1 Tax=Triangularia verruculosa TaxID=2587418 RepID=A0AAN6X5V8_9PEZI|nr:hypothetical protein QBC40DRAFT_319322 [Triangularia verruculosa]
MSSTTSYLGSTIGTQWPPSYNSTTAGRAADTERSIGQPPEFDPPTPPVSPPWSPPVPRSVVSTHPWPYSDTGGTTVVGDHGEKKRSMATKWFLAGVVVALLIIVAVLGGVFGSRLAAQNSSSSNGSSPGDSDNGSGGTVSQGKPTAFPGPSGGNSTPTSPPGSHASAFPTFSSTSTDPITSDSSPTFESNSVCQGNICPSLLSVVQYSSPPTAFLFGLGQDNAVWYRTTNGEKWLSDWESLGGDMISQPSAASLDNNVVDVVVYARNNTIQTKRFYNGQWNDTWFELGKAITSPPYAIACGDQQLDVVIRGTSGGLYRIYYKPYAGWSAWENHGGGLSSYPVIGCGPGPWRLAVLGFKGTEQPLFTSTWLGSWTGWNEVGGNFRGQLAIASRTTEESFVFGITVNRTMAYYHWTKSGDAGTNRLVDLGGSFQSTPVVFVSGAERLDVLGVGRDDRLKHKAMIGQTWAKEWQDLGGAFNSTPAVVSLVPGKVSVYGLGVNGTLFHGTWKMTKEFEWSGGPDWLADGGELSMTGMKFSGY